MIKSKNSIVFILVAFFIFNLILSFSRLYRWDFMNHVFMIDQFFKSGTFYPTEDFLSGVSVYPPGNLIFGFLSRVLIGENHYALVYVVVAALSLVLFVIFQSLVSYQVFKLEISPNTFLILIITYLTFFRDWYIYALEYKPDLIAYMIGIFILYIYFKILRDNNTYLGFLLGILFSLVLLMKQQYIAMLLAVNIVLGLYYFKSTIDFLIGSVVGLVIVFLFYLGNPVVLFWNYGVVSDDGWLSYQQWLKEHSRIFIMFTCVLPFLLYGYLNRLSLIDLSHFKALIKPQNENKIVFERLTTRLWLASSLTWLVVGILSSWKAGGNAGNTAWGLVLFAPLASKFGQRFSKKYLFALLGVAVLINVWGSAKNFSSLANLNNSTEFISKHCSQAANALVDSESYFAWRKLNSNAKVEDIITYSMKDNKPLRKVFDTDDYIKKHECIVLSRTTFGPILDELALFDQTYNIYWHKKLAILKPK